MIKLVMGTLLVLTGYFVLGDIVYDKIKGPLKELLSDVLVKLEKEFEGL